MASDHLRGSAAAPKRLLSFVSPTPRGMVEDACMSANSEMEDIFSRRFVYRFAPVFGPRILESSAADRAHRAAGP